MTETDDMLKELVMALWEDMEKTKKNIRLANEAIINSLERQLAEARDEEPPTRTNI